MTTFRLDCTQMTDRETAHDYLARTLNFPAWYGRNLDALYDLLTGHLGPARLVLVQPQALKEMGSYGHALLDTFQDAARNCSDLELILEDGEESEMIYLRD